MRGKEEERGPATEAGAKVCTHRREHAQVVSHKSGMSVVATQKRGDKMCTAHGPQTSLMSMTISPGSSSSRTT